MAFADPEFIRMMNEANAKIMAESFKKERARMKLLKQLSKLKGGEHIKQKLKPLAKQQKDKKNGL